MTDSDASHSDSSAPTQAPFAPAEHYCCPPRLGISHLLIWTAVVAVNMKLFMASGIPRGDIAPQLPQALSILLHVNIFVFSATHAAAIVGIFILLRAKIRDRPARLQPGHWFVLAGGVAFLVILSCSLLLSAFRFVAKDDSPFEQSIPSWFTAVSIVPTLLQIGIYFWATWASKGSKRWQVPFALLATASLLHIFTFGIRSLQMLSNPSDLLPGLFFVMDAMLVVTRVVSVAAIVVLSAAVVLDLIHRERRDWLHWVGIAIIFMTTLVQPAIAWVWMLLYRSSV